MSTGAESTPSKPEMVTDEMVERAVVEYYAAYGEATSNEAMRIAIEAALEAAPGYSMTPIFVYDDDIDAPSPTAAPASVGSLLAVIHGDGGHYEAEHGTEKAARDAIDVFYAKTAAPALGELAKTCEMVANAEDNRANKLPANCIGEVTHRRNAMNLRQAAAALSGVAVQGDVLSIAESEKRVTNSVVDNGRSTNAQGDGTKRYELNQFANDLVTPTFFVEGIGYMVRVEDFDKICVDRTIRAAQGDGGEVHALGQRLIERANRRDELIGKNELSNDIREFVAGAAALATTKDKI